MSFTPDLSGLNPDYFVSTYQRTIFVYAQKIMFDVPVFNNAQLVITKMGTIPEKLILGKDFIVYPEDIDIDAISVCMNIQPTFNGVLLKSITMLLPTPTTPFKIQATFNQLFMDSIEDAAIVPAANIEVTPELISNMVQQIAYLQQMILNNGDQYSPQSSIVKVALVEDPTDTNSDNEIQNEPHDINTLTNNCLIRTIYGAFFKDSVSLINTANNNSLVLDTDYSILDLDLTRTQSTSNTSGVYRIIKILTPLVGTVGVSYHAYGGEADVASMRSIQNQLSVITQYLESTSYITPKTLPADPSIVGIKNKLQEIEGTMRLLLKNGIPTYGDATGGTAVLQRITSQDTLLHWWNLATMYRVAGSVDDVMADVFKFRITTMISGMMFECSVDVNVNLNANNRITVTCNNSNLPYDALALYSPKLRIVQVNSGGVYSGVVLQLGMQLSSGILQETFAIEDMSGSESCWLLVPSSAQAITPQDTGFAMPNGTFSYSASDPTATVNEATIPFTDGVNILMSGANLPMVLGNTTTVGATENFNMVVQSVGNIDVNRARAFLITATANIGTETARNIVFEVPIDSKDHTNKRWSGSKQITTSDGTYTLSVVLWYSAGDTAFRIGYYVNATNQSTPLNVIATKFVF